jgi:hypothetical protein
VANSSLDLSDRAALGPLARLLSAVRRAAGDTPVLLVGAAARDLLLVPGVGIVPKEHPDVGGILARCGVPPVRPGPDLQESKGRHRGDLDGDLARNSDRDGGRQGLGETGDTHDLGARRGPGDASIRSLDAAEGNDVQPLIAEPKAMQRTLGGEGSRPDESLAQA